MKDGGVSKGGLQCCNRLKATSDQSINTTTRLLRYRSTILQGFDNSATLSNPPKKSSQSAQLCPPISACPRYLISIHFVLTLVASTPSNPTPSFTRCLPFTHLSRLPLSVGCVCFVTVELYCQCPPYCPPVQSPLRQIAACNDSSVGADWQRVCGALLSLL